MPTLCWQLGSVTCFKRGMFLVCQWCVASWQTCIGIVEDILPVQMKHVLGIIAHKMLKLFPRVSMVYRLPNDLLIQPNRVKWQLFFFNTALGFFSEFPMMNGLFQNLLVQIIRITNISNFPKAFRVKQQIRKKDKIQEN